mmetsp:Transcript_15710/g.49167  ORF Transcript_15710/g.49167 Transcript_15710/m.49167 type:complete len:326 (+) Transcript_15710:22-999(+)
MALRTLRSHNRFEYSPIVGRRAEGKCWPNGSRVAFYIGLNLEHFSFGEGLGGQLVPGANTPNSGDVLNYSWREYGNRVGGFRLLEALDAVEMPCSVLLNGSVVEHAPALVEAHVARGDEIVGHGWTNSEKQGDMDEETEREMIARTTSTLETVSTRPTGWLGPWISQTHATPDLLQEAGYEYLLDWCHDDAPVYMKTRNGTILSVPYPQELNDIPTIMVRRASAQEFAQMIIDQLDEMLHQAAHSGPPLVLGLALHPYIIGQPFRLRHLRRALDHVARRRSKLWITTAGAIAKAYRALDDGSPPPPAPPYYDSVSRTPPASLVAS